MKVLLFGSVFPRREDDPEVPWLRETLIRLKSQGVEVEMLAPAWRGLKSHQIDGIHVHRFRYAPACWEWLTHDEGAPSKVAKSLWMRVIAASYIFFGTLALFRLVRRHRYDVIHAHWPFPHALMALPVQFFFKTPLVLNFHGAELMLTRKFPWVAPLLRLVIGRADAIVANSSFTAERIKALRACEVAVIPYGSPLPEPQRQAIPFQEKPWRILFVGRHIERKGISYLIKALEHLRNPQDWQLRIVGEGDLTKQLKLVASASSCAERILFLGRISTAQLEEEYASASLFVLPAIVDSKGDTEGLGVVLIEAVAVGLPLVASRVGGIVDVVIDGETGLLVDEKEPQQLAAAFERLAADSDLRLRMIEEARRHCSQEFSWERVMSELLALYRDVLRVER